MEAEARITSVENWQIQRQGWTFEVTDKAEGSQFRKVAGSSNFQKLIDLKSRVAKTCQPCQPVGAIFSGRC